MFAINVVVAKSSLSSERVSFKSQYFDQFRSNVCKQKLNKRICTNHWINTWSRKCFRHSMFSIEYIQLFLYFFIVSANRALFCFVFHRIFQILTRRKQKTKISLYIYSRFNRTYRSCIFLFCFLLSFSNFNETSTSDEKLFIQTTTIQAIVVVIVATIKLISIRKWFRLYKTFSDFLFSFFSFHRHFRNRFRKQVRWKCHQANDIWKWRFSTRRECWFRR